MSFIVFLAELSDVLQNLFQEIEELLAVDVVLESELCVVFQDFLEDLVRGLFIDSFSVANEFDVLLGFLVKYHVWLSGSSFG
jgi:hypothetical protein